MRVLRSRPLRCALLLLFITMLALGIIGPALAKEEGRHVLVAEVDGIINPVTQRYISRAIEKGEKDGAEVLIIKLDTPGGLLSSTQKIVEDLLSDRVATVVYVHPTRRPCRLCRHLHHRCGQPRRYGTHYENRRRRACDLRRRGRPGDPEKQGESRIPRPSCGLSPSDATGTPKRWKTR